MMSITIPLDEVQVKLKELVHKLGPGDVILITENQEPVAKLVGEAATKRPSRVPGNCAGKINLLIEDDEHLEGFADYI